MRGREGLATQPPGGWCRWSPQTLPDPGLPRVKGTSPSPAFLCGIHQEGRPAHDATAGRDGATVAAAGTGSWPPTQCTSDIPHTELTLGIRIPTESPHVARMCVHTCTQGSHRIFTCMHTLKGHRGFTRAHAYRPQSICVHVCTCTENHTEATPWSERGEALWMDAGITAVFVLGKTTRSPPEPPLSTLPCPPLVHFLSARLAAFLSTWIMASKIGLSPALLGTPETCRGCPVGHPHCMEPGDRSGRSHF